MIVRTVCCCEGSLSLTQETSKVKGRYIRQGLYCHTKIKYPNYGQTPLIRSLPASPPQYGQLFFHRDRLHSTCVVLHQRNIQQRRPLSYILHQSLLLLCAGVYFFFFFSIRLNDCILFLYTESYCDRSSLKAFQNVSRGGSYRLL